MSDDAMQVSRENRETDAPEHPEGDGGVTLAHFIRQRKMPGLR
jgi:hypothetical protein